MAAARNPKLVFNKYKTNCVNTIKKIETFIATHTNVDLNANKILKLKELNAALKDQFACMELGLDTSLNA